MNPVSTTIAVDAPRERVFELICDLAARPSFTDHFITGYRVERIPAAGVGAGARFRVGPARDRMWMETVIHRVERPHRVEERGAGGRLDRIPVFTSWELVTGPGSTTEVTVSFWTEPATRGDRMRERLGVRGWYRRRWRRALHRLKAVAEAGRAPERVVVAGADRVPVT